MFRGRNLFAPDQIPAQVSETNCSLPASHPPHRSKLLSDLLSNDSAGNARGCASAPGTPPQSSLAKAPLPAAGRRENNSAGSCGHQGTAARFGRLRAANQFKAVAAADSQIFRLDYRDGRNIRQIKNADQTRFTVADFAAGFRRNDLHARPGWKLKCAVFIRISLRTQLAHAVFADDVFRRNAEPLRDEC